MAIRTACAECGTPLGASSGIDPYKHTVACFKLQDYGRERLLAEYGRNTDERSRRIVANLKLVEA